MNSRVHQRFGAATTADAEAQRLFAFNRGFCNLFSAVGTLAAGWGCLDHRNAQGAVK